MSIHGTGSARNTYVIGGSTMASIVELRRPGMPAFSNSSRTCRCGDVKLIAQIVA